MLDPSFVTRLDESLTADEALRHRRFPGESGCRQPVHTAYVPADRFSEGTVAQWREQSLAALREYGPMPGVDADLAALVGAKLATDPIEDLRIDVEDGYGTRPDGTEDEHVRAAARALATMLGAGTAPAFVGIRIKSLEETTRRRGLRTLDLFLDTLLSTASLPAGFRVTLPKVSSVRQVEAMVEVCRALESGYALGPVRFELQIETPQAVLGPDGVALVAPMLHAAAGRCAGLHYGTYDYTASLGIAAPYQSMEHPAADHAKAVMQVAAAGTGVAVCDGSTNVLPVGDLHAVHAGWRLHMRLVRRSLERGFYQGWDLHPAQLPSRYAATFGFYRDGAAEATGRLRAYLARAETGVLDEPATARALARFLVRALACGAIGPEEVPAGLDRRTLDRLAMSG